MLQMKEFSHLIRGRTKGGEADRQESSRKQELSCSSVGNDRFDIFCKTLQSRDAFAK